MQYDCGFDEDGRGFRYRAAAIIMRDGKVLMAATMPKWITTRG